MNRIYIFVIKQLEEKYSPAMHTMYFQNPPMNTDVVLALKDFLSKYRVPDGIKETVNHWIDTFEKRRFEYYASDLKYGSDSRDWKKEKLSFTLSMQETYPGTPGKD